jgi:hypothetical protein
VTRRTAALNSSPGLKHKPRCYPRCEDCGKAFTACGGRTALGPIAKVFYPDPENIRLAEVGSVVRMPDKYRYVNPPWVCGRTIRKASAL